MSLENWRRSNQWAIMRDQLDLATWLLLGAVAQAALCLVLPYKLAVLPALALFVPRLIRPVLQDPRVGLLHNTKMDGVQAGRTSSQVPDFDGRPVTKGGQSGFVLFVIGFQSNHPLGLLGPGGAEMGKLTNAMFEDAEVNAAEYGYLGRSKQLLGTGDSSHNALLTMTYWRTVEGLHAFTRGPGHKAGWDWYNKMAKTHPHIGIMHELYETRPQGWENLYANFKRQNMGELRGGFLVDAPPTAGMTASKVQYDEEARDGPLDGKPMLRSAEGREWASMYQRMGRS